MIEEEWPVIEDAERVFRNGYVAAQKSDCPYKKASIGPYVLWMQGWYQHQRDRARVAEAAGREWCRSPVDLWSGD